MAQERIRSIIQAWAGMGKMARFSSLRILSSKFTPLPIIWEKGVMIKNFIKSSFSLMGYEINRISVGKNAFRDMQRLTETSRKPIVIDVGANEGQSIIQFHSYLDHPIIHAFEPGDAFSRLQRQTSGIRDVHLNNFALGSESSEMNLITNEDSKLSSLLEPSVDSF